MMAILIFTIIIAIIAKRKKLNINLIIAFLAGIIVMVITMVLANIALTPLYTGVSTSVVIGMLMPAIIPINAIMGIINSVLVFAIYKGIKGYIKADENDTN